MSDFERDTVLRQVRQFGQMVAAILARVRETQDFSSGLESLREVGACGPGAGYGFLDRLDAHSAAALLPTSLEREAYADFCTAAAEMCEGLARHEESTALRDRARTLRETKGGLAK